MTDDTAASALLYRIDARRRLGAAAADLTGAIRAQREANAARTVAEREHDAARAIVAHLIDHPDCPPATVENTRRRQECASTRRKATREAEQVTPDP